MFKSDAEEIVYILFIISTYLLYQVLLFVSTEYIPFTQYLLFYGAEIPVICIIFITVIYNIRQRYTGLITFFVAILVILFTVIQIRYPILTSSNAILVSTISWGLSLTIGSIITMIKSRL